MSADVADSAVKDEIDSTTQEAKINGSAEPTNGETLEEKIDMDHSEQKPSTSAQAELEIHTEDASPKFSKSFVSPGAQSAKSTESHIDVSVIHREPAYAEVCSFFNAFSALLSMNPIPFTKIEKIFTTLENGKVDRELIDLHIQLMRKIWLKSARADRFEQVLQKFCVACPLLEDERLQLERFGYASLSPATKLIILKALCESQFDCNVKFRENIFNTYHAFEIRLTPIGSDKNGVSYYFQKDCELNIRVYTVEPGDMSGATWSLKARSEYELALLITELMDPEFGKKAESKDEEIDEDQLLGDASGKNDVKTEPGILNGDEKKPLALAKIEMTPEEMEKIELFTKKHTLVDQYRDGKDMNKRKLEKEARKKGPSETSATEPHAAEATGTARAKEASDEEEENPADMQFSDDDRKILPRRSARNAALTNIKAFVSSPQKKPRAPKKDTPTKGESQKTAETTSDHEHHSSSGDEEDDDEEDVDESEENSSDDEFKIAEKKAKGKGGRRRRRRTSGERAAGAGRKKAKAQQVTFVEESSDDEEEVEDVKERKKATEETLCMQCRSSKRPDLLLLCDMCDDAWHTWCLKPALWFVPDGDWFCPKCHHTMLIQKLSYGLIKLREELKTREGDQKKKEAAAERLKREMDFIGVSLNNILPSNSGLPRNMKEETSSESEEEDDGGEHQRKSKKRALKKFNHHRQRELPLYDTFVTIAEGRSRRMLKKVDYNFHSYDEQLQEAMDDESSAKPASPVSGLGRGKDMQNIIEAENKRKASADNTENTPPAARPPSKKQKKHKRLTDLDIDNATESDTTSYKATSASEVEEPEPSDDEYVPEGSGRRGRGAASWRQRQSDEEFIDDGSESDYTPSGKKGKSSGKRGGKKGAGRRSGRAGGRGAKGRKRGRGRRYSESDESVSESEEEEMELSEASSSEEKRRSRKGGRAQGRSPAKKSKWAPKASSDEEEDEEELEPVDSGSSEGEAGRTEGGRPLRRAAAEMKKKMQEIDSDLEDEDAEEEQSTATSKGSQRPVGALTRPRKVIDDDDEEADEFKPDEDEDENDEDEEDEEPEEDAQDEDQEEEEPPTLVNAARKDQKKAQPAIPPKTAQKQPKAEPAKPTVSSTDKAKPTPVPTAAVNGARPPTATVRPEPSMPVAVAAAPSPLAVAAHSPTTTVPPIPPVRKSSASMAQPLPSPTGMPAAGSPGGRYAPLGKMQPIPPHMAQHTMPSMGGPYSPHMPAMPGYPGMPPPPYAYYPPQAPPPGHFMPPPATSGYAVPPNVPMTSYQPMPYPPQPYPIGMPPNVSLPQPLQPVQMGAPVDPNSLGSALAGAMDPDML